MDGVSHFIGQRISPENKQSVIEEDGLDGGKNDTNDGNVKLRLRG